MHALIESVERFGSPRIALIGDFMLDRYVYGDADRISPEAPVPVLNTVRTETRAGGAANVAMNILSQGGKVVCIGIVGQDTHGEELHRLLGNAGAETSALLRAPGRQTTVKSRFVGLAQHRHAQQMFRVDAEMDEALSDSAWGSLHGAVRSHLRSVKLLVLQDYNKGVLTDERTPLVIADARQAGCPVVVDPARIRSYARYRGATLLTPNRYEAELASGVTITDDASLERASRQIVQIAQAKGVVITLDKEGAYLYDGNGPGRRIPTRVRSVYDVSGAGDAVLAMLAVSLGEGCDWDHAVALANVAGGLEVERLGVVAISREEVLDELRHMIGLRGGKVVSRKRLIEEVARRRHEGQTIVFTNGCFDLLHMGHIRHLRQARELGSCLIVAINSDHGVKRLKGDKRPIIGHAERSEMLGALECVDYVTVFDEETPEALLEATRPDILVKGGTTKEIVGRRLVEGYGGRVLTLEKVEGLSTTRIIDRIIETNERG